MFAQLLDLGDQFRNPIRKPGLKLTTQEKHRMVNEKYLKKRDLYLKENHSSHFPGANRGKELTESQLELLSDMKYKQVSCQVNFKNQAMLEVLEIERRREIERQIELKRTSDVLTREEMQLRFVIERDNAAKVVKKLAKKQREEIETIFQH